MQIDGIMKEFRDDFCIELVGDDNKSYYQMKDYFGKIAFHKVEEFLKQKLAEYGKAEHIKGQKQMAQKGISYLEKKAEELKDVE